MTPALQGGVGWGWEARGALEIPQPERPGKQASADFTACLLIRSLTECTSRARTGPTAH